VISASRLKYLRRVVIEVTTNAKSISSLEEKEDERLKNQFFAALGLTVLTGLFMVAGVGGSNAAPPSPTPQDVKVVNTGANPIPTQAQGTTNIAGVVQAQQSRH